MVSDKNYLNVQIVCTGSTAACQSNNFETIVSSAAVNPNNYTHPWINYLKRFSYRPINIQGFIYKMTPITLNSDYSMFPLQKSQETTNGYEIDEYI